MNVYGKLTGEISGVRTLSGTLSSTETLEGSLTIPAAILPPSYEGEYEVTPGEGAQVLSTDHLYMKGDIVIDPIPSNYGLITYDGSEITVS
ncbi:MAG: hypothetical protein IJY32_03950 [Mogibacterium sp.]|nr:hypothetical protein [Mogibacterium sp.]